MASGFALKAAVRERTGKGAARALRRTDMIPAVIYGNNEPPIAIAVPWKEMTIALYAGGFKTHIWSIDVGGKTIQALARDYQREPVKDRLMHIDFLRVTSRSRVTVDVPVHVLGEDESPGLRAGGVMNLIAHTVSVEAPAARIPGFVEISVAGLEVGSIVTSEDVTLPADVVFALDDPFPIAAVAAPMAEEVEEEPEVAADAVPSGEGEGEAEESADDAGEAGGSDD